MRAQRLRASLAALALAAAAPAIAGDMQPLDDAALSAATAQQGVLVELKLRNNVDASNTPIGCTAVVGVPNPCRLGIEFGSGDTWLMLKEFYGTLEIREIRMDAAFLPATNTPYYNPARFRDALGNNLIPGANPAGSPAIQLSYPGADAANTYADLSSFMNIGRTWLEFDTTGSPITRGYDRDTSLNSVLGVRMADSSALNAAANMRFLGNAYVYGF